LFLSFWVCSVRSFVLLYGCFFALVAEWIALAEERSQKASFATKFNKIT